MIVKPVVVLQAACAAIVSVAAIATAPPASACINNPMVPPGIAGNCPADINALPEGGNPDKFNQEAIDAQNGVGAVGQVPKMVVVPGA